MFNRDLGDVGPRRKNTIDMEDHANLSFNFFIFWIKK
jgi:hypothetical protein